MSLATPDAADRLQALHAELSRLHERMTDLKRQMVADDPRPLPDYDFTRDMGYQEPNGDYWPGVSIFRRQPDGGVVRVARDYFGPGDAYCGAWTLFDLLDGGAKGWQPKFAY